MVKNALIMGAAGRDFHNFNTFFRGNNDYNVVAFTAAQISELQPRAEIADRVYPHILAGEDYPEGIKIFPESRLEELISEFKVDEVFFCYSDVSHEYVMDQASRVISSGSTFVLLGPRNTMLKPLKPLVSVCAARTGSGKSPTSRWIIRKLKEHGLRVVVIRHPMPYGVLKAQIVQRFETLDDLDKHRCTIEEREDYEPHLREGVIVYSGVDYEEILRNAEDEADILVWDGGNNDFPFYVPDIHVVLVDPLRPGHELRYYPGQINVRMADVIVISKVNTAKPEDVEVVRNNVRRLNPEAKICLAEIVISVDDPSKISGKKVLVIEDGPTVTHGGMSYGAGTLMAKRLDANIVDPRKYASGSIKKVYELYPHLDKVLPAVGYGKTQMDELREIINRVPAEVVLLGTPTDISRYLEVDKPCFQVKYELVEINEDEIWNAIYDKLVKSLTESGFPVASISE